MGDKKVLIGFLGGSFDPIHNGHLTLALQAKERFGLDQIFLCPAFVSPFKVDKQPVVSPEHRYNMVSLALEGMPGFSVLDIEIKKPVTSYTIDTIKELKKRYANEELSLILMENQLIDFVKWKDYNFLMQLAPIKVGHLFLEKDFSESKKVLGLKDNIFFKVPHLEISSTYLRKRLASNLYCKHLMSPKVVDYIHQHQLYLTH